MFTYAGAPWLTQKWVYNILTKPMKQLYGTHDFLTPPYYGRIYKNSPEGYIPEMDDDAGTMAAWYVLASMGLFQVCVGEPVFEIVAPLFEEVKINLDSRLHAGSSFIIRTIGGGADNYYVQSATLNGDTLERAWISYDEIVAGGELVFELGSEPNKQWGAAPALAPPSMSLENNN
jgi:putative alpha-1,2-mannosidase